MKQIFSWGYEAPNKHDFTKKEQTVTTKIRKMKRAYISESHDNFRRPEQGLFNYFDQQDFELLKKRVYGLTIAAQNEGKLQSAYQEFFDSDKMKILKSEVKQWTAAGGEKGTLKLPQDFLKQRIEETLVQAGFTKDIAQDISISFRKQIDELPEQDSNRSLSPLNRTPERKNCTFTDS